MSKKIVMRLRLLLNTAREQFLTGELSAIQYENLLNQVENKIRQNTERSAEQDFLSTIL